MAGAALQLLHPQIDTVGDFQQAQAGNNQLAAQKFEMAQAGLKQIGSMALGVMGGKLDGQADPAAWEQAMDMLGQTGFDVTAYKGRPDLAPILARASLDTMGQINAAQNERELDLRMQEFEQKIAEAAKGPRTSLVPVWGQQADGSYGMVQPSETGVAVQTQFPKGFTPLPPVQQLNAGDRFEGVDKFGNRTGSQTLINNQGAAFDTAVGRGFGEQIMDARTMATDAQLSLAATQEARKLLDSGMITGFGADVAVGFGKALQQVGISLAPDAIANTEAFIATRAQEVGRLIKMFGAGTGLSDADREFATKAAAGSIEMTEASIRRILDINERASKSVLARYNEMVTPIQGGGSMPGLGVAAPSAAPSAGGDDVVEWTDMF